MPSGRRLKIIVGKSYGGWRVLGPAPCPYPDRKQCYYRVLCLSCKKTIRVYSASAIAKKRKRCCLSCASRTHGQSYSPTYRRWLEMLRRTGIIGHSPNKRYIGIPVAKRWRRFPAFFRDMGECPSLRHTLGRLNSRKGYYPRNCAWQTAWEQARYRTSNIWITICGLRFVSPDLASFAGLTSKGMFSRLKKFGPLEAITRPMGLSSVSKTARSMHYCKVCQRHLPVSRFFSFQSQWGRTGYSWLCRACLRPALQRFHRKLYRKGKA